MRHLAVDGGPTQPHLAGGRGGRQPGLDQLDCGGDLVPVHQPSAWVLTLKPGRRDAVLGALGDQPSLEMGHGAEHVEHELSRRRAGVASLLKAEKRDMSALEDLQGADQLRERAAEAVKTHDGQRVAGPRVGEKLLQTRPIQRPARAYILKDAQRAGGFEPLRHLSPRATAVLGLVSTKTPELERKDDVLRRIEEASEVVPPERLAVSPQCGFASVEEGNPVSPDDQRRKLELVVDVAGTVWPSA